MDTGRVSKKKVHQGKVTKHEGKYKKPKVHIKSEDSDDESKKVGLKSPDRRMKMRWVSIRILNTRRSVDQEGGASLVQSNDVKHESKETKKQHKKDRLREKALKQLVEEDPVPSPAVSDVHTETEAQRKKNKKTEKRNAKQARERQMAKQALAGSTQIDGDDVSMADAKSTPADLEKLESASSEDEDMEDGGVPLLKENPGYTAPPSGVNRTVRRRFILIEREKAKIKKDLAVPEGSDDKAEEVKRLLDQFTEKLDARTAERVSNRKNRKTREAARVRGKKTKLREKASMKERRAKPKVSRDE